MKAQITISLDNGVLSFEANMGNAETLGVLEAAKYAILRQSFGVGTAGRPPEPGTAPGGSARTPGLSVRKLP